jgi:two-component system, sensor histidine kinase and response regulator
MFKAWIIGDQLIAGQLKDHCGGVDLHTGDEHRLRKALDNEEEAPHVVILPRNERDPVPFLQMISSSKADTSVILLAHADEIPSLHQRIVFLPFTLAGISVLQPADTAALARAVADHASRTEKRRSYQKLKAAIGDFRPGGIATDQMRDSFLGHFMDEASTGAILLNAREEVIYLNKKARELLPTLKIAPPNTFFSQFPAEYAAELRSSINKPYSVEPLPVRMGDEEEIHLKFKLTSHKDLQETTYHIIIIYDVTDSVLQARALEERIKERNEFITVLSHDLKNPISGLVMSAQMLAGSIDELSHDEVRQLAQVIDNTSKQLLMQFDQLVDWARTRQEMSFKPEPLKLRRRLDDALKLVKDLARQKQIEIHNEIRHDAIVTADPHMVRSIFQNLVTNAIKFTPEGGHVTIRSRTEASMEQVCVQDDGMGMSDEVRDRILNNESTTTPGTHAEPGTGLGLILAKEFIARHNGSFSIGKDRGKGTVICFTLPRHA